MTTSLVQLWCLNEADDVAVCVFDGGEQLAPADVSDSLVRLHAGVEERLQTLLDVVTCQ